MLSEFINQTFFAWHYRYRSKSKDVENLFIDFGSSELLLKIHTAVHENVKNSLKVNNNNEWAQTIRACFLDRFFKIIQKKIDNLRNYTHGELSHDSYKFYLDSPQAVWSDDKKDRLRKLFAFKLATEVEIFIDVELVFQCTKDFVEVSDSKCPFKCTEEDILAYQSYCKLIPFEESVRDMKDDALFDYQKRIKDLVKSSLGNVLDKMGINGESSLNIRKVVPEGDLGRLGAKFFLQELDLQLRQNPNLPFKQIRAPRCDVDIDFFQGMIDYINEIKDQPEKFPLYDKVFIFDKIDIVSGKLEREEIVKCLAKFLELAEHMGMKEIVFSIASITTKVDLEYRLRTARNTVRGSALSDHEWATLEAAVEKVSQMKIRFAEFSLNIHQESTLNILYKLEGINDHNLMQHRSKEVKRLQNSISQLKPLKKSERKQVSYSKRYFNMDVSAVASSISISTQGDVTIFLPKTIQMANKQIQIQRQHQLTQQHQQQVTVQQAWQRDLAIEKNKKTQISYSDNSSDLSRLLTREDIVSVERNDEAARELLGDELYQYQFLGKSLLDLWDALCGDAKWNSHFKNNRHRIRAISQVALLKIAQHAEEFQYGLVTNNVPNGFVFVPSKDNALCLDDKVRNKSQLAPSLSDQKQHRSALSAFYLSELKQLPIYELYTQLCQLDTNSHYQGHHLFLKHFQIINSLHPKTLEKLIKRVGNTSENETRNRGRLRYVSELLKGLEHYVMRRTRASFNESSRRDGHTLIIDEQYANAKELIDFDNRQAKQGDEVKKQQLSFLMAMIKKSDTNFGAQLASKKYQQLLKIFNSQSIKSLIGVFIDSGAAGIEVLLDLWLLILKHQELDDFKQFYHCFISRNDNYSLFLSDKAISYVKQLLQFNSTQLNWFYTLSQQHLTANHQTDFIDLMAGFEEFLSELAKLEIIDDLPNPCPLKNVGHLKVGLNRVLLIIENAINPKEQLQLFDGVSLHVDDAPLVLETRSNYLITKEMRYSRKQENKIQSYLALQNKDFILKNMYSSSYDHPFNQHRVDEMYKVKLVHRQSKPNSRQMTQKTIYYYNENGGLYCAYKDRQGTVIYEQIKTEDSFNSIRRTFNDANKQLHQFETQGIINLAVHQNTDYYKNNNFDHARGVYQFAISCFYRYLGQQRYINHFHFYHDFINHIHIPSRYHLGMDDMGCMRWGGRCDDALQPFFKRLIQIQLLPLIAYATTGKRNMNHVCADSTQRIMQLERLLLAIFLLSPLEEVPTGITDQALEWQDIPVERRIDCAKVLRGIEQITFDPANNVIVPNLEELTCLLQNLHRAKTDSGDFCYDFLSIGDISKKHLQRYGEVFINACVTFNKKNHNSNYMCYLELCELLYEFKLKDHTKRSMVKLLAVVSIKGANHVQDRTNLVSIAHNLMDIERNHSINNLLLILSNLHAKSCTDKPFLMTELVQLIDDCMSIHSSATLFEYKQTLFQLLKQPSYSHLQLTIDAQDIEDASFSFRSAKDLEMDYQGLGIFYSKIKSLCLVGLSVEKGQPIQFLDILKELLEQDAGTQMVSELLTVLQKSNWQGVNLSDVNQLLRDLLRCKQYVQMPIQLLTSISPQILDSNLKQNFFDFFRVCLNKSKQQMPVELKQKLIKLASISILNYRSLEWFKGILDSSLQSRGNLFECFIVFLLKACSKNIEINELESIFSEFSTTFQSTKKPENLAILIGLLNNYHDKPHLLVNLDTINYKTLFQQLKIISHAKIKNKNTMAKVRVYLKTLSEENINKLAQLYEAPPYLATPQLLKLIDSQITLKKLIKQHASDPHLKRDAATLERQFDTRSAYAYIKEMAYLDSFCQLRQSYGEIFINVFYKQFHYINTVGKNEIRLMSMLEIRKKIVDIRQMFMTSSKDVRAKDIDALLYCIAACREVIYHTSSPDKPVWVSEPQILSLLCQLQNQFDIRHPLYLQMATGEGKSISAAMSSVLAWVQSAAVINTTHQENFSYRDLQARYDFYQALAIPVAYLTANSTMDDCQLDGINYLGFTELSLIVQAIKIKKGIQFLKKGMFAFILDEADACILHNNMNFNLTMSIDGERETNPYAWAFKFLMNYVKQFDLAAQRQIPGDKIPVKRSDLITALKRGNGQYSAIINTPAFRSALPNWLISAWGADHLKEDIDFIIKVIDVKRFGEIHKEAYAAVLINHKPMSRNVTYTDVVQQCLHTRLNEESAHHFPIASGKQLCSSMTALSMMDLIRAKGTNLLLMSATTGSAAERAVLSSLYRFRFLKLPRKQASKCVVLPDYFCQTQEEQFKVCLRFSIEWAGNQKFAEQRHAVLIPVESIEVAEAMYDFFLASKAIDPNKLLVLHARSEKCVLL